MFSSRFDGRTTCTLEIFFFSLLPHVSGAPMFSRHFSSCIRSMYQTLCPWNYSCPTTYNIKSTLFLLVYFQLKMYMPSCDSDFLMYKTHHLHNFLGYFLFSSLVKAVFLLFAQCRGSADAAGVVRKKTAQSNKTMWMFSKNLSSSKENDSFPTSVRFEWCWQTDADLSVCFVCVRTCLVCDAVLIFTSNLVFICNILCKALKP